MVSLDDMLIARHKFKLIFFPGMCTPTLSLQNIQLSFKWLMNTELSVVS